MKAYGYSTSNKDLLLELDELSICSRPDALRRLANFINQCADEIEREGETWEHKHFQKLENSSQPEFVVFNIDSLEK